MYKRRKLRNITKKSSNCKGLLSLYNYLEKLEKNSYVVIVPAPDVHEYFPHRTFHGHAGKILERYKSNIYKIYVPSLKKYYFGPKAHLKLLKVTQI